MLRREFCASFKVKNEFILPTLATNILTASYSNETHLPDVFLRICIEDSIRKRVWVDYEYCQLFVANVMTECNTKLMPKVNNPLNATQLGSSRCIESHSVQFFTLH